MYLLPKSFFLTPDVVSLARQLIGKMIRTEMNGQETTAMITETEAYQAPEDKASHAFNFRRTKRTQTMFLPGGHAYVYLNYGIHHLFNVVTGPEGLPHAILIRAILPVENQKLQCERRKLKSFNWHSGDFNGPGKISQALGITTQLDAVDLTKEKSPIQLLDAGIWINPDSILARPRIGIPYAEEYVDKPWRFTLDQAMKFNAPGNISNSAGA